MKKSAIKKKCLESVKKMFDRNNYNSIESIREMSIKEKNSVSICRTHELHNGGNSGEKADVMYQLKKLDENAKTESTGGKGRIIQKADAIKMKNQTGLSDAMKDRLERKTGFSADDLRVYRNSPLPATMGALAISEGSNIHLGPGNDGCLNHELGHWVQKKMGRVRATKTENGIPINDDSSLEREADQFSL